VEPLRTEEAHGHDNKFYSPYKNDLEDNVHTEETHHAPLEESHHVSEDHMKEVEEHQQGRVEHVRVSDHDSIREDPVDHKEQSAEHEHHHEEKIPDASVSEVEHTKGIPDHDPPEVRAATDKLSAEAEDDLIKDGKAKLQSPSLFQQLEAIHEEKESSPHFTKEAPRPLPVEVKPFPDDEAAKARSPDVSDAMKDPKIKVKAKILSLLGELTNKLKGMEHSSGAAHAERIKEMEAAEVNKLSAGVEDEKSHNIPDEEVSYHHADGPNHQLSDLKARKEYFARESDDDHEHYHKDAADEIRSRKHDEDEEVHAHSHLHDYDHEDGGEDKYEGKHEHLSDEEAVFSKNHHEESPKDTEEIIEKYHKEQKPYVIDTQNIDYQEPKVEHHVSSDFEDVTKEKAHDTVSKFDRDDKVDDESDNAIGRSSRYKYHHRKMYDDARDDDRDEEKHRGAEDEDLRESEGVRKENKKYKEYDYEDRVNEPKIKKFRDDDTLEDKPHTKKYRDEENEDDKVTLKKFSDYQDEKPKSKFKEDVEDKHHANSFTPSSKADDVVESLVSAGDTNGVARGISSKTYHASSEKGTHF